MDPNDLIKDALTSASIGGAGAAARAAMSKNKVEWRALVKQGFAGAVMAVFVGFAVKDVISSEAMRYAAIGFASVIAPELFESIISIAPAVVKKIANKIIGKL